MPIFWDNSRISTQLSQPQLTRVRHPYRGPRSSYRINLEINQLAYDILRLYSRVGGMRDNFSTQISIIGEGGDPTGPAIPAFIASTWEEFEHMTWGELSTETWSSTSLLPEEIAGTEALSVRLQSLRERVAKLERA
jgi:hypothetical protein